MCHTMGRMTRTEKGFICEGVGDYFGRKGCGYSFDFPNEFLEEYMNVHAIEFKSLVGKQYDQLANLKDNTVDIDSKINTLVNEEFWNLV